MMGAFCAVAALYTKRVTLLGQHVDTSVRDIATSFIGPALLDCAMNGREQHRQGNEDLQIEHVGPVGGLMVAAHDLLERPLILRWEGFDSYRNGRRRLLQLFAALVAKPSFGGILVAAVVAFQSVFQHHENKYTTVKITTQTTSTKCQYKPASSTLRTRSCFSR